jgi:acetyltransferase
MGSLRLLLEPKSVALIAGSVLEGPGAAVAASLLCSHQNGNHYLIAQDRPGQSADRWFKNIGELPIVPDLAVICTTAAAAAEALDQAGRKGVKAAVVITADPFGSDRGSPFKKSLREVAGRYGCRLLGPGSAGVNLPAAGFNASWMGEGLNAGKLALVSQSASIAAGVVEWAIIRQIGLSRVISTGDEIDVSIDEIFDYLAADQRTTGILLYLRSLSDGRSFVSSARAVARIKPILVLKPRTDTSAALSGTGKDDQDAIYDAVFRRAGILRVYDTEEWFDAAENLDRLRHGRAGNLAILANGSGPGRLAAAPAAAAGLLAPFSEKTVASLEKVVPAGMPVSNPLDLGRDAASQSYSEALHVLRSDAGVAAALAIFAPSPGNASAAVVQSVAEAAKQSGLHILACWFGGPLDDKSRAALAGAKVTLYDMPEKAARAFVHLGQYRRNQEALRQIPALRRQQLVSAAPEPAGSRAGPLPAADQALLLTDEKESTALLAAYGKIWRAIKARRSFLNGEESINLLRAYGFSASAAAYRTLGLLPLSLALSNDPTFGRMIIITAGGRRMLALPPLNNELTEELASDAESALRLAGGVQVKRQALQELIIRLADLAVEFPEIVALEIPAVAMDASNLVVLDPGIKIAAPEHARNHLSIHPYPRELEERLRLRDEREIVVRPIRLEDIPLYHDMLKGMPAQDLFLRFCSVFGDLTQAIPTELLANLVGFDYSRDMTFVAVGAGKAGHAESLGLVDAFISPGREQAEYSILVRADIAGMGLGKILMTKIIDYCRANGVGQLFGLVLRHNTRMLGLCTRLGFAQQSDDNDDDMVKVVLPLGRRG